MALINCGGLWFKEGKNGEYLSGPISILGQQVQLFCFPKNQDQEDNPNAPDYTINFKVEDFKEASRVHGEKTKTF